MNDTADTSHQVSESGEESPALTHSQALTENSKRLDQLEQMLTEDDETHSKFLTAIVVVLGIKCPVMETYLAVLDNPQVTTAQLIEILEYDRRGLNKHLCTLREKGLVFRERAVDGKPGAAYAYTAKSPDETADWMQAEMEAWSKDVVNEITIFREQYLKNIQNGE